MPEGMDRKDLMNAFAEKLKGEPFLVLDGALATELERAGFDTSGALWSARALADAPDLIRQVHRSYLEAGADVITTASYQGTIPGFLAAGYSRREAEALLRRSVRLAKDERDQWEARTGRRALVAASMGPYGAYLADGSEYRGRYGLSRAALAAFHRERLAILAEEGLDLFAFETVPDLAEAEAVGDVLAPYPPGCAWISFSCADGCRTSAGDDGGDCAAVLKDIPQFAALGVNCTAPAAVAPFLRRMHERTALPLAAYPNSGEVWDGAERRWTGRPADLAALAPSWHAAGARLIGGCCRTTPETIRAIAAVRDRMRETAS